MMEDTRINAGPIRSPALCRILSLLIILTVVCAFFAVPAAAEEEYVDDSYVDPGFDFPDSDVDTLIPGKKYDLRNYGLVHSPKNQGDWGTCWSFATITSLESNLAKQKKSGIDLSERHLAYFSYNHQDIADLQNPYPGLEGIKGDFITLLSGNWKECGGNILVSSMTLSSGLGAVTEDTAPYIAYKDDGEMANLPANLAAGENAFQVTNSYWVGKENKETIQKYLRAKGAGSVSIYADPKNPEYCKNLSDGTYAYYVFNETDSNHAVTLIGWDDTFPKENFANEPEGDGAWLIQNSWGNKYTYLWVSYYDTAVSDFGFFDVGVPEYDSLYQYDGTVLPSGLTLEDADSLSMANVYTAKSDEMLNAVSFFINDADVRYTVEIYKGVSEGDPESGKRVLKQTGFRADAGGVYVPLKKSIPLYQGEVFSVVITINPKGPSVFCFTDTSYTIDSWSTAETYAEPGQSYLRADSYEWDDISADGKTNLRVKAFTTEGLNQDTIKTGKKFNHLRCSLNTFCQLG